jgi:hypothetical protein
LASQEPYAEAALLSGNVTFFHAFKFTQVDHLRVLHHQRKKRINTMGAGNLIEIARVRDAIGCRELLERARHYDKSNKNTAPRASMLLQTVASLIHDFGRMKVSSEEGFEILEQIRIAAIEGFDKLKFSVDSRQSVPVSSAQWEPMRRVMLAFKAMRNHYKRIYMGLLEDEGLQTRTVIQGTANSLRTVMPLARAMDCQSRMIAFALLNQVSLDAAEWDELSVMARHLRVSTFLDEALPDPCALIRPNTARALYVYPMLLWLAKPHSLSGTQLQIVDKLARKWSAKVGFRIDAGQTCKENLQGPSIALTHDHALRLDTHKLLRSVVELRAEIADPMGTKQSGLPAGMSLSQVGDLLNFLEGAWGSSGWLDGSEGMKDESVDVSMRLGLPISRESIASEGAGTLPKANQVWFSRSQGEAVKYFPATGTIVRKHSLPAASSGMLLSLSTKKARPSELVIGVLHACAQVTDVDLAPPFESRLLLKTLPGTGRAVDILLADSLQLESAYCLYAQDLDEHPSSIVMPAGRCQVPCEIEVRETSSSYKARLEIKIERIAGFERLSLTKI